MQVTRWTGIGSHDVVGDVIGGNGYESSAIRPVQSDIGSKRPSAFYGEGLLKQQTLVIIASAKKWRSFERERSCTCTVALMRSRRSVL